jgi:hypothetical protein
MRELISVVLDEKSRCDCERGGRNLRRYASADQTRDVAAATDVGFAQEARIIGALAPMAAPNWLGAKATPPRSKQKLSG